jgi:hypothetical protein
MGDAGARADRLRLLQPRPAVAQVARRRVYWDNVAFLSQLGVMG